jgi:ferredoxin
MARIHPLNAKGKYYIDQDSCTCSAACEYVAPQHFAIDEQNYGAYVYKQPETPDEDKKCKEAMMCCPFEAILDDGEKNNH